MLASLLLSYAFTFLFPVSSYFFPIYGNSPYCFIENVHANQKFSLEVSGTAASIVLAVSGPSLETPQTNDKRNEKVYTVRQMTDEEMQTTESDMMSRYEYDEETGERRRIPGGSGSPEEAIDVPVTPTGGYYYFCFQKPDAQPSEGYVVFFTLNFGIQYHETKLKEKNQKLERISDNVKRSMDNLLANLNHIHSQQEYYVFRLEKHLDTIEGSSSRLIWYNVLSIMALIAIYTVQIKIFKSWFEPAIPTQKPKVDWGA